jgi:hypothetical protein
MVTAEIVMSYEAGALRRDIAARHKISVRSVGRLLRMWRAEREDVAGLHVIEGRDLAEPARV